MAEHQPLQPLWRKAVTTTTLWLREGKLERRTVGATERLLTMAVRSQEGNREISACTKKSLLFYKPVKNCVATVDRSRAR